MVFGLDIDNRVLFEEERIKCFFTDQSKQESLENTIYNINSYIGKNIEYDFIIDDGSHVVDHMILTFNTLKKYLKSGGIYVIEDIKFKDLDVFKKLESNEYKIIKVHDGNFEWDSFVAFLKN
jgi:cephalosporin hydroxylase